MVLTGADGALSTLVKSENVVEPRLFESIKVLQSLALDVKILKEIKMQNDESTESRTLVAQREGASARKAARGVAGGR